MESGTKIRRDFFLFRRFREKYLDWKMEVHCSWFIVGELFQEYPDLEKRLYPFRLYSPRYFVTWNRPTQLCLENINTDVTEEEEQDFIYKTFA